MLDAGNEIGIDLYKLLKFFKPIFHLFQYSNIPLQLFPAYYTLLALLKIEGSKLEL
jgi:hypothetical protein